ncbi:FecR protein [Pseudobythopirellula maris]|uniref:FecR protein n=1 Tax=Pseudobythopirellula maris TaxID=2527991 RepID=A0A5C5ZSR0_9BACT|nr:FecR domain-containing protein [Pseudobythopirellula maris]TWT90266.1 FecR protein [Pseudobythopirellula maris]
MNTNRPNARLRRLLDAALVDRLSDPEREELDAWMREDDRAIDLFVKYCQLDAALYFEIRAAAASRRATVALEVLQQASDARQERRVDRGSTGGGKPARKARWWETRHPFSALAAAALFVFGVGVWYAVSNQTILAERQPQPVARLASVDGAEWLGEGFEPGHQFVEADSVYLTAGSARISMASGAEIALRAPCFVTLDTPMGVGLEEGVLTAQVADWAHGFSVITQSMRVVDLGTKFAVSADGRGSIETHVLDGQVRVEPLDQSKARRRSLLLSGGEALRVQHDQKLSVRLKADREFYDAELNDVLPYKPIRVFNTGGGLTPGDEDQHWRVVAGPRCEHYTGPQFAVVCEADRRYLPNDPQRSQWISLKSPLRPGIPQNTTFTFQTKFDLTGYNLSSVVVAAQVIADNGVKAVRINGADVPFESWTLNERDQVFNRFNVIEINEGFVAGTNTVEFDVWNGVDRYTSSGVNPLAIRVEWHAFGRLQRRAPVAPMATVLLQ